MFFEFFGAEKIDTGVASIGSRILWPPCVYVGGMPPNSSCLLRQTFVDSVGIYLLREPGRFPGLSAQILGRFYEDAHVDYDFIPLSNPFFFIPLCAFRLLQAGGGYALHPPFDSITTF